MLVGQGKPAFPSDARAQLELLEERRFGNGVVYSATAPRADAPGGSAPSLRFDDPNWGRVSGDEQRMLEAASRRRQRACTERRSKVTHTAGSGRTLLLLAGMKLESSSTYRSRFPLRAPSDGTSR